MWNECGKRYAYRVLRWKPEGKRPHGRPNCRWNILLKFILIELYSRPWTGII
jgi:hypothetical protein